MWIDIDRDPNINAVIVPACGEGVFGEAEISA